jgi:hypothetical protein
MPLPHLRRDADSLVSGVGRDRLLGCGEERNRGFFHRGFLCRCRFEVVAPRLTFASLRAAASAGKVFSLSSARAGPNALPEIAIATASQVDRSTCDIIVFFLPRLMVNTSSDFRRLPQARYSIRAVFFDDSDEVGVPLVVP